MYMYTIISYKNRICLCSDDCISEHKLVCSMSYGQSSDPFVVKHGTTSFLSWCKKRNTPCYHCYDVNHANFSYQMCRVYFRVSLKRWQMQNSKIQEDANINPRGQPHTIHRESQLLIGQSTCFFPEINIYVVVCSVTPTLAE